MIIDHIFTDAIIIFYFLQDIFQLHEFDAFHNETYIEHSYTLSNSNDFNQIK